MLADDAQLDYDQINDECMMVDGEYWVSYRDHKNMEVKSSMQMDETMALPDKSYCCLAYDDSEDNVNKNYELLYACEELTAD